jgi:hypothetical protein
VTRAARPCQARQTIHLAANRRTDLGRAIPKKKSASPNAELTADWFRDDLTECYRIDGIACSLAWLGVSQMIAQMDLQEI